MPSVAIVGSQWGDEGKGKITDFLAEDAEVVVRYQGGNNAGHTVIVGSDLFKLHLIPSGAIHPGTQCVLGNGVVIDPIVLLEELAGLRQRGVSDFTLHVSERAHVILPYHRVQDELEEAARGDGKIGTTGRGIGPAYVDKVARSGIRMIDFVDPARFRRAPRSYTAAEEPLAPRRVRASWFHCRGDIRCVRASCGGDPPHCHGYVCPRGRGDRGRKKRAL